MISTGLKTKQTLRVRYTLNKGRTLEMNFYPETDTLEFTTRLGNWILLNLKKRSTYI